MPKKLTVTTKPVEIKLRPLVVKTTPMRATTKSVLVQTNPINIRQIQAQVDRLMSDPTVIAAVKQSARDSSD